MAVNTISGAFIEQIGLYLGCKHHLDFILAVNTISGAFIEQIGLYLGCKHHLRGFHRAN
ncbi:hypothetical protein [Gracilibacillus dipsosauri]|uniref:hypothetical protein n=1 Tax=Gracilibacillus dipsosauri TaxID=178340 RepID=UPI0015E84397|nr:hypothetical protein [Gracilibacillus dipsosauri]